MGSKHKAESGEWWPPMPKSKPKPPREKTSPRVTLTFKGGPMDGKTVDGYEEDFPRGRGKKIPMKGGGYVCDLAARCYRWEAAEEKEAS